MTQGRNNRDHALADDCKDPDCEIHNPEVIEDASERMTAQAWFYAGAMTWADLIEEGIKAFGSYEASRDVAFAELRDCHMG